jgi:hypothetical protein
MYSDVMHRTQIYLGKEELEILDRAAAATGASRSELIRRAIHHTFGAPATGPDSRRSVGAPGAGRAGGTPERSTWMPSAAT